MHGGEFLADDTLAVAFLLNTEDFKDAKIVRTRKREEIERADVVCDIGCIYDHEKRRYDHHQPDFHKTFNEQSSIDCASCGLVYIHLGSEIIQNILKRNGRTSKRLTGKLYKKMYFNFVQEVDANDNGIDFTCTPFSIHTGISARIHDLNRCVKNLGRLKDECFMEAVHLIGNEFEENLLIYYDEEEAIERVKSYVRKAYETRFNIDESCHIVLLDQNCNFKVTLQDLERREARESNNTAPKVYYVLHPSYGQWQCTAINEKKRTLRKPLPCRGLKDEELSNAYGIPGGIFVHKKGFMAKFTKRKYLIKFAKYALQAEGEPQVQTDAEEEQHAEEAQTEDQN